MATGRTEDCVSIRKRARVRLWLAQDTAIKASSHPALWLMLILVYNRAATKKSARIVSVHMTPMMVGPNPPRRGVMLKKRIPKQIGYLVIRKERRERDRVYAEVGRKEAYI
jgi:hypothetical protein